MMVSSECGFHLWWEPPLPACISLGGGWRLPHWWSWGQPPPPAGPLWPDEPWGSPRWASRPRTGLWPLGVYREDMAPLQKCKRGETIDVNSEYTHTRALKVESENWKDGLLCTVSVNTIFKMSKPHSAAIPELDSVCLAIESLEVQLTVLFYCEQSVYLVFWILFWKWNYLKKMYPKESHSKYLRRKVYISSWFSQKENN